MSWGDGWVMREGESGRVGQCGVWSVVCGVWSVLREENERGVMEVSGGGSAFNAIGEHEFDRVCCRLQCLHSDVVWRASQVHSVHLHIHDSLQLQQITVHPSWLSFKQKQTSTLHAFSTQILEVRPSCFQGRRVMVKQIDSARWVISFFCIQGR